MEGIAGSRRHHKPVKSNITEVRQQPLATLIVAPIALHHIHYHIFIHFLFCLMFSNVSVLKMPLDPLNESGPKRKLISVS